MRVKMPCWVLFQLIMYHFDSFKGFESLVCLMCFEDIRLFREWRYLVDLIVSRNSTVIRVSRVLHILHSDLFSLEQSISMYIKDFDNVRGFESFATVMNVRL